MGDRMNVDYFAIGQRIKQVRRDRGMTQERLAEALSVSVGYISQIERGVTKISLETLAAVAACLACDLSELATGVAVTQEHYLDRELAQLTARMDGRQKKLLHELAEIARQNGGNRVYIATDHANVYEKYGCTYLDSRSDIDGEISRIYTLNA